MIKWNRTERINAVLSVCYSKDGKYKIEIFKERSDLYWGDLIDIYGRKILSSWHNEKKSKLIEVLKQDLPNHIQKNVKITPKKEAKMARKSYKDILRKNAAKGRKSQKRARELKKDSVTATMKRVKALLFRGAKGKNNGNTGYVGRIAKGKYIYRTKKSS